MCLRRQPHHSRRLLHPRHLANHQRRLRAPTSLLRPCRQPPAANHQRRLRARTSLPHLCRQPPARLRSQPHPPQPQICRSQPRYPPRRPRRHLKRPRRSLSLRRRLKRRRPRPSRPRHPRNRRRNPSQARLKNLPPRLSLRLLHSRQRRNLNLRSCVYSMFDALEEKAREGFDPSRALCADHRGRREPIGLRPPAHADG
jgi:hypothetical protein